MLEGLGPRDFRSTVRPVQFKQRESRRLSQDNQEPSSATCQQRGQKMARNGRQNENGTITARKLVNEVDLEQDRDGCVWELPTDDRLLEEKRFDQRIDDHSSICSEEECSLSEVSRPCSSHNSPHQRGGSSSQGKYKRRGSASSSSEDSCQYRARAGSYSGSSDDDQSSYNASQKSHTASLDKSYKSSLKSELNIENISFHIDDSKSYNGSEDRRRNRGQAPPVQVQWLIIPDPEAATKVVDGAVKQSLLKKRVKKVHD